MWKRSSTLMLGILLAMGAVAATAAPASAAGTATISDAQTGTFTLADGTVATVSISGDGARTFTEGRQSLSDWSGTDAMYADGVSARDLPVLTVMSAQNCGTADQCGEGRITVRFDRPVDNPAIHIAEFGAGSGSSAGWAAADGIRFASADGGATSATVSAGATFVDGGGGYHRGDIGIKCSAPNRPGGCGSLTVPGTKITEIVFDVARFSLSPGQTAGREGYGFGVTATATPDPKLSGLSVSKTVDRATAAPGDELDYTITVKNTGEADAREVPVTDTLPPGLTGVTADRGGEVGSSTVTWTIDDIPAGGQSQLHVRGTVDRSAANTSLVNRVVTKNPAGVPDTTPAPAYTTPCIDDRAAACATTVIAALPALSVAKTVDKQVAAHGEVLTYTVVVANSGTTAAVGVPVVDQLPTALTEVSADREGVVADGAVRWSIPEVPAGGEVELHVTGTAPGGLEEAQLLNRVMVQNPTDAPTGTPAPTVITPCPDDALQACALTVIPAAASLEISKTVKQSTAQAGAILDYTIAVTNTGPGTAVQIPVVDDLPDRARFIAASTGGVAVKDRVGWMVEEILPGQTVTMTMRAQIPADATTAVVNRATVAYDRTMIDALRSAAVQAGIAFPDDLSELPDLPLLTAAHPCRGDESWSCAVTTVTPAPAGLAQTGGTFALAIPAVLLLAGGAFLIVTGARRKSNH